MLVNKTLLLLALAAPTAAFTANQPVAPRTSALQSSLDASMQADIRREVSFP